MFLVVRQMIKPSLQELIITGTLKNPQVIGVIDNPCRICIIKINAG
jgi:hypothetical protein